MRDYPPSVAHSLPSPPSPPPSPAGLHEEAIRRALHHAEQASQIADRDQTATSHATAVSCWMSLAMLVGGSHGR